MAGLRHGMGIAALALLAGCAGEAPTANIVTIVETDDANVVVPGDNAAAGDALSNIAAAPSAPALNLAPEGLSLVDVESGSTRHVTFGTARDTAVPMVTAALGRPKGQSVNQECGAGPLEFVDFQGGLTMLFQDARFAGWDVDGRDGGSYGTANGVAIGTTLRELRAAGPVTVEQSTLGTEFDAGGIGGLLSGPGAAAKVTNLWAGTTCAFR